MQEYEIEQLRSAKAQISMHIRATGSEPSHLWVLHLTSTGYLKLCLDSEALR